MVGLITFMLHVLFKRFQVFIMNLIIEFVARIQHEFNVSDIETLAVISFQDSITDVVPLNVCLVVGIAKLLL